MNHLGLNSKHCILQSLMLIGYVFESIKFVMFLTNDWNPPINIRLENQRNMMHMEPPTQRKENRLCNV